MCWHTPPCPFPEASLTVLGDTRAHSSLRYWETVLSTNKSFKVGITQTHMHTKHAQNTAMCTVDAHYCVYHVVKVRQCCVVLWASICPLGLLLIPLWFWHTWPTLKWAAVVLLWICCRGSHIITVQDIMSIMLVYVKLHRLKGFRPISSGDYCIHCTSPDALMWSNNTARQSARPFSPQHENCLMKRN